MKKKIVKIVCGLLVVAFMASNALAARPGPLCMVVGKVEAIEKKSLVYEEGNPCYRRGSNNLNYYQIKLLVERSTIVKDDFSFSYFRDLGHLCSNSDDTIALVTTREFTFSQGDIIEAVYQFSGDVCWNINGIQSVIRFDDKPFFDLVRTGTPQEVENAIKNEENVNAMDKYGVTPLMMAARNNPNPEVIKVLVKAGADVNAKDNTGSTPLMRAAMFNHNPEVITVLVKAEADVNANNNDGLTPLIRAAMFNHNPEVITALIKAGADVNENSNDGRTPLMSATSNSNLEVMAVLLEAGAEVNVKDRFGTTPLMSAAVNSSNPEVITTLLRLGADSKVRDRHGKMAIEFARENPRLRNTDAFRALEEASR
ncbi:MAG: ankyrin repeat domain-containing protein [Alphaproteobacteria bacterium]|nr:ankyrin repeat domain-containing protein [Alphaproteobacteria bacterium]